MTLGADGFSVRCDGQDAGRSPYGQALRYAADTSPGRPETAGRVASG